MRGQPDPTRMAVSGAPIWRADQMAGADARGVLASGHAALDAQLPGGGWPLGALTEILQVHPGQAEWRLLLPALRTLAGSAGCTPGQVVLVGPPHQPFGPGLAAQGLDLRTLLWVRADTVAQRLWASEQALRCSAVSALLVWLPEVRAEHLRRLQLAAQQRAMLLFVLRPDTAQHEASPAVLRLRVDATQGDDSLRVQLIKRRGPPLPGWLSLRARAPALHALLALSQSSATGHVDPEEDGHALDRLAA